MAKPGTSKYRSLEQENAVAKAYGGKRSASSGGAAHDAGDIRTPTRLIEAKTTGTPLKPAKSASVSLAIFEKVAEEAYEEGRQPMLALRIQNPNSPLADHAGNIDLVVRLMRDDIHLKEAHD